MPLVGLGTWRAFDVPPGREDPLGPVLEGLVGAGGTLVDTSPMYGRAEEVVGDLAGRTGTRPSLFLATKVWTSGRSEGEAQMKRSLRRLGMDRLDLIQVHNLLDAEVHLRTLFDWKAQGRVRFVGVTHYLESAVPAIEGLLDRHRLDFVQINYSLGERGAEKRLLPRAAESGVAILANRPFGSGDLLGRTHGKPLPPWADEVPCRSWAQFLLKFVVSHPAVTCAIPATDQRDHVLENLAAGASPLPDAPTRARMAAYFDAL